MSGDPIAKFISVIDLHFPKPRFASEDVEDAWVTSMVKFLAPYDDVVLGRAAEHILKTRDPRKDGKWFPVPSEIIAICDTFKVVCAVEKDGVQVPLLSHGQRDSSEWASWRGERADELIQATEVGRVAAKQGWVGALWSFIRFGGLKHDRWGRRTTAQPDTPRLPTADEVAALKAEAKVFDEALDRCERGEAGAHSKVLAELGRQIRARRDEKAALTGEI